MKYPIIIWICVILVLICIVFLPYGYSESKYTNWFEDGSPIVIENCKVKWIYLEHHFILDRPRSYDPIMEQYYNKKAENDKLVLIINFEIEDLQILWHIVFIELLIVFLVTGSILLTIIWNGDRKSRLNK